MFRLECDDKIYTLIHFSDVKIHLIDYLFRNIFTILFILK